MGGEEENVLSETESALPNPEKRFPGFSSGWSRLHVGTTPRRASSFPFALHFYETETMVLELDSDSVFMF